MIKKITTPISLDTVKGLKAGDRVLLTGRIVTARDAAHKLMIEKKPDFVREYLKESVIYHCGPVVSKDSAGKWHFVSAGPTTSSREEPYEADVIQEYTVRGVIGKGGMGAKTSAGLQKTGAVYLHAVGGAGALIAECVKNVETVLMYEELGSPEAFWVIDVVDFPLVVTMDAHGASLHAEVLKNSEAKAKKLLESIR
ncbi:hypothetical protein RsTz2092_11600 [Deferribacterales bacterium RsTz2092]|nr:hypothetical protein AGMMS49941_07650 [Deferribacterales bacterium]